MTPLDKIAASIAESREWERKRKLLNEPNHYQIWDAEYAFRDALEVAVKGLVDMPCCCEAWGDCAKHKAIDDIAEKLK